MPLHIAQAIQSDLKSPVPVKGNVNLHKSATHDSCYDLIRPMSTSVRD